jgi:nitrite reductase/ring-hydroxylating ferredoxin subunit
MRLMTEIIDRIERTEALDAVSKPLVDFVAKAVRPRAVRNWLSGTPLGHPLHPMLTDVPIGAWTMASFLDLCGGEAAEPAADLLVKAGALAALPTAASGLNDWSDTYGPETRIGLVHAGANSSALLIYLASARARKHGHRGFGKLLGLLGLGTLVAGSYLGGHLSFGKGTNVNRTAWQEGPGEWTPVLAEAELGEAARKVDAGGVPVLLCRDGGRIRALANTCSHMGGPLDEGTFADGCVTCPWHGSVFRLSDGGIVRGPATTAQPHYETRVQDGQIEVRRAS